MVRDVKDGQPWSEMDIVDLQHALAWGESIEETARFLGRFGTIGEVRRKAKEQGLRIKGEQRNR
jgi:hypothetical protein